jgi:hypothetical protein
LQAVHFSDKSNEGGVQTFGQLTITVELSDDARDITF